MIELKPSKATIDEARQMAEEMGKLRNSITKGDGNLAGFVGEVMMRKYFDAKQANTYDYDLLLPDGSTVDVKTKRINTPPKPFYECNIPKISTHQTCDYYSFIRLMNDLSKGWLLGLIKQTDFFDNAAFEKEGTYKQGFTYKTDTYTMSLEDVWKLSKHEDYK